MKPQDIQQDILSRACAHEDNAFLLTTDGSGHDGVYIGTGSAFVLRPLAWRQPEWKDEYRGACGMTKGSVQRAEHQAFLEGLRCVLSLLNITTLDALSEKLGFKLDSTADFPPAQRIRLAWYTDRQNLAFSVARDASGIPYYRRRTDLDLWAQFEFYEPLFDITVHSIARNSNPDSTMCDAVAGRVRQFMVQLFRQINPR